MRRETSDEGRPRGSASAFQVLPAIDLRGGRVVRLTRGRFELETAYGSDPAAVAASFAKVGARWIHVVDLDGAREGRPMQASVVRLVVRRLAGRARVEVGGGLRTLDAIAAAFDVGVDRVALGTRAIRETAFAADAVARWGPDRISAALDVRAGEAVGEGWRDGAPGRFAPAAARELAKAGVRRFEVTAIDRDGTLAGPDLEMLEKVVGLGLGEVIASGGIGTVDDLLAARAAGCGGAIVGRAIYDGRLDLAAAVAMLSG